MSSPAPDLPHDPPRPQRRWWHRVVVAALLAVLALGAGRAWRHTRRHQAIAAIERLGGHYSEGARIYPAWTGRLLPILGDRLLALFATPCRSSGVNFQRRSVTNADLKSLACLDDLGHLDLAETLVTDEGLAALRPLTRLESLSLAHTAVTDAGLPHLRGMTRLAELRLDCCSITDAGMPHLQALARPGLLIHLEDTRVSLVRAGDLHIRPARGGLLTASEPLLIEGRYTAEDSSDVPPHEISIQVNRHGFEPYDSGWDGQAGRCLGWRVRPGEFAFQARIPGPDEPGAWNVHVAACIPLRGFRGIVTVGASQIEVHPAAILPPGPH